MSLGRVMVKECFMEGVTFQVRSLVFQILALHFLSEKQESIDYIRPLPQLHELGESTELSEHQCSVRKDCCCQEYRSPHVKCCAQCVAP